MGNEGQPPEVLVVCYGNICRSPMGEVLLQRALDERLGPGVVMVTSAGVGADDGRPPSQGTIRALASRGIDARSLRSTYLTPAIAQRAWRIYCMEEYQVRNVRALLDGEGTDKVMLMDGEEVPDPFGSADSAYENVALQIERLVPAVVEDIAAAISSDEAPV